MDFLDSIERQLSRKKSLRMRSWYMYEQFKELERSQLVAAEHLRTKADQDRFLRQELSERRERRRLCAVSSSDMTHIQSDCSRSSIAAVSDYSFDQLWQLQDDEIIRSEDYPDSYCSENEEAVEQQEVIHNSASMTSAAGEEEACQEFQVELNEPSPILVGSSLNENIRQCMNALNTDDNDIEEKLKIVKSVIKDNMHLQLGTIRDNMKCFEQFTKMRGDSPEDYDEVSPDLTLQLDEFAANQQYLEAEEYDNESVSSKIVCGNGSGDNFINIYSLWSKLVSFAYQLVRLNRGNFYYDYGAQFLTAVLACDVLRRGLNRMCDYLQRYTCPVKYPTEQNSPSSTPKVPSGLIQNTDYRNGETSLHNTNNTKCPSEILSKLPIFTWYSRTDLNHIKCSNSTDSGIFDTRLDSWYFSSKLTSDQPSTIWPEELNSVRSAFSSCRTHHSNPMLTLADLIDDTLKTTTCESNL